MDQITVKNVSKTYGGVKALDRCSLAIEEGGLTAIIGPNGAGKTTLFNVVSGFEPPDRGTITFKGEDITGLSPDEVARHGLTRTFQLGRLFKKLTAEENVLLGRPHRGEQWWYAFSRHGGHGHDTPLDVERSRELLTAVGLKDKERDLAASLSFGQQKLLEIARALATEAEVLLLDEPMAGVHPSLRDELKRVIRSLHHEGKTVVFIEHDMETVADLAEHVIVLAQGRVVTEGTFEAVSRNRKVVEVYLGKH